MGKSLRLEPDVARQIVAECDRLIARLEEHALDAERFGDMSGFGDIPSAQALQAGFARKGTGGEESVHARILQFRDAVVEMRDNFAGGGMAFAEAEQSNARDIRSSGAGLQ
ncbi:hypothetical protein G4X40_14070 [Rhodococcus sp. D2-41]|uniref:Uncharacterized protein n=1 Tax=Speluncibacter jeojiensis TaxID=2710754 RepID=A0A9X4M0R6_9ACTN|nr:hypothetical protein [Rhodococcus sp. D2-41]MDG3011278.1 hypothetical protein [Rhodococcus sp. D2-41]MDG3015870.1 hypothetical protein [Corynebacteriales bacterium D3-21]